MFEASPKIENQKINWPSLNEFGITLSMKREDLLHPTISGNKFRKLKYNIAKVQQGGYDGIITFGGAWSNHIYSTAAACQQFGVKCIGVIRGEEPKIYSDTLKFAQECGMQFHFVSREEYKEKDCDFYKPYLRDLFGNMYVIPEGGSNYLGVQGCTEILQKDDGVFTDIVVAAGTGSTAAGIALSIKEIQNLYVYPALKGGSFLKQDIEKSIYASVFDAELAEFLMHQVNLVTDYHFGGYAKIDSHLVAFINQFYELNKIKLDPVYTGKMMYGLINEIEAGKFKAGSNILAIHTGGLQGVVGIENRYGVKFFS